MKIVWLGVWMWLSVMPGAIAQLIRSETLEDGTLYLDTQSVEPIGNLRLFSLVFEYDRVQSLDIEAVDTPLRYRRRQVVHVADCRNFELSTTPVREVFYDVSGDRIYERINAPAVVWEEGAKDASLSMDVPATATGDAARLRYVCAAPVEAIRR